MPNKRFPLLADLELTAVSRYSSEHQTPYAKPSANVA